MGTQNYLIFPDHLADVIIHFRLLVASNYAIYSIISIFAITSILIIQLGFSAPTDSDS